MLLEYGMVVLFCLFFYVFQIMGLSSAYEDAAGIWHYDRYRPLLEALLNFGLNLIMVQYMGLYGILLSTILSMALFSWPWLLHNLFRRMFQRSMKPYLFRFTGWISSAIFANGIVAYLCKGQMIKTVGDVIWRVGICIVVPGVFLLIGYGRSENIKWLKEFAN